MLNGREFHTRTYWVCACSGGHFETNPPTSGEDDPKCIRKGGEWRTALVDPATGDDVGVWMEPYEAESLVEHWNWQPMGDDLYLRPGVSL